jgi:uncharacterized protein (DUF58 family)
MPTPPLDNLPTRFSQRKPKPLTLNTHLPPLRDFTPTKDIRSHPLFQGILFPWVWRIYTQRLTRVGHYFLAATFVFMAFGSFTLDQQWYIPFTYAFGLWTVALLGMFGQRPRVRLQATHAGRISAGETLPVEIELEAIGRRGIGWIVLPDRLPPAVDAIPPDGVGLPVLAPGETAHLRLGLYCKQRGAYTLCGFRVETAFPLGMMVAQQVFSEKRSLLVYPRFTPLARLEAPGGRRYQPGEAPLASHLGDSLEFIGNRDYREGDPIRSIDWRATARLNRPVVREYREEYLLRAAVLLDTHTSEPTIFERAVSMTAAVSDYMARADYLVDLFAAGPELHQLTTGHGTAFLDDILDLLACVESQHKEEFETLEQALMEYLSQITIIVCVFLDWDTVRQGFVERLHAQGAGVKVIIVRDTPCTLPPPDDQNVTVLTSALVDMGVEAI